MRYDMSEMGDRILKRMKKIGKKQTDIVIATGASKGTVSNWVNNKSKPTGKNLLQLAEVLGCSAVWLSDGTGLEVAKKNAPALNALNIKDLEKNLSVKRDPNLFESVPEKPSTPTFVDIPYYQEAELSLGSGTIIHDDEHPGRTLSFQQGWLDSLGLDVEHLVVVKCTGRSMEPRIYDKDVVLINKKIETIEDGAIYAINYAGDAKLKRLITRADGSLIIRSDNKSEFPDEIVAECDADQLKIIGKAVWVGGML